MVLSCTEGPVVSVLHVNSKDGCVAKVLLHVEFEKQLCHHVDLRVLDP